MISVGQIYLAADGSKHGQLVIDSETYKQCGDVLTLPFTEDGFEDTRRIDAFKLTKVRYSLVDVAPDWMPKG